jgi:acyl-[acyl-carrier-protein] desaturase
VLAIDNKTIEAHHEVLAGMQETVAENLSILGDVEKIWQPSDYLPDLTREDWSEQLQAFREPACSVSDELLIVLVGDMVTEEALPSYSVSLNRLVRDNEGDSPEPWARWLRGWTAEENRHGDLLNAYLRLTGRVDMRAVEVTVQHLLANGFNTQSGDEPYSGLIYTSFQERATKVSHRNVGRLVNVEGDPNLAKICLRIAGDESRHELFYTRMMNRVLDLDPEGGMLAIRRVIQGLIAMPGKLMYDGKDPDLFDHFAVVAQRTGVYTVRDYADILDHLVKTWHIAERPVTGEAALAQEFLCRQAQLYHRMAERYEQRIEKEPRVGFSWIYDRKA